MLRELVLQQKPDFMALQETWHLPMDDADLDIPGYRYYGRPRRTPAGHAKSWGGVGMLVSDRVPPGSVKRLPDCDEAGSTGSLWLEVTLQDGSTILLGNIYSECDNRISRMGLDMPRVWHARGQRILSLLEEGGGNRPLFLLGDMNVHVGDFQDLGRDSPPRRPLLPVPTTRQAEFARPFKNMVRALPLALLNGRKGGEGPSCFPCIATATSENPSQAAHQRRFSTLDLALTRDTHLATHVRSVDIVRVPQPMSDHRLLVLHGCLASPPAPPLPVQADPPPARPKGLRLPHDLSTEKLASLTQALELSTSSWYARYVDVLGPHAPAVNSTHIEDAYLSFATGITAVYHLHLDPPPPRATQMADARHPVERRLRTLVQNRSQPQHGPPNEDLVDQRRNVRQRLHSMYTNRENDTTTEILATIDRELFHTFPPNSRVAYRCLRLLQDVPPKTDTIHPVYNEEGFLVHHEAGISAVHSRSLERVGTEPDVLPHSPAHQKDEFVRLYDVRRFSSVRPFHPSIPGQPLRRFYPPRPKYLRRNLNRKARAAQAAQDSCFQVREIQDCLGACNLNSAAGEDELTYRMLQLLSPTSVGHLCLLYNASLRVGHVPQPWCTAIVRPLYKGNSRSNPEGTTNVDKYRGISLGSCLGKILEKAMAGRIERFLALASPLMETQNGFRSRRNALSHAWALAEILALRGPNALVIFFDLVKAFPSVRRSSLLTALYDRGITGSLWHLTAGFYRNNTSKVRIGHFIPEESYRVSNGVKEGSLLSPLLFIIFIDELLIRIRDAGLGYHIPCTNGRRMWCGMMGYADDLAALPMDTLDAQGILNISGAFATEHVCTFSDGKTFGMLVRPTPGLPSYPGTITLTLRGKCGPGGMVILPLSFTRQYEYLGIIFSDDGTFTIHMQDKLIPSLQRRFYRVGSTVAKHDILAPRTAMMVIDADVLSYARYSAALWGMSLWCPTASPVTKTLLSDIRAISPPILKDIASAPQERITSTRRLFRELGWLGIDGVILQSQMGILRSLLAMPVTRVPYQVLLLQLRVTRQRLAMHQSPTQFHLPISPPTSPPLPASRLPHLHSTSPPPGPAAGEEESKEDDPAHQQESKEEDSPPAAPALSVHVGFWTPRRRPGTLLLGPVPPHVPHRERRLANVTGLLPSEALRQLVPRSDAPNVPGSRYVWQDLAYDLRIGALIIPEYEELYRGAQPSGWTPPAPRGPEAHGFPLNAYVRFHYPSLRQSPPLTQSSSPSAFVASVAAILYHAAGESVVLELLSDAHALRVSGRLSTALRLAYDALAQAMWVGDEPAHILPGRPRRSQGLYLTSVVHYRDGMSLHLRCLPNSIPRHKILLIMRARIGALAFGATIDALYPGLPSFCPCCLLPTPDTPAHHFMSRCSSTRHISDASMANLLSFATALSPQWALAFQTAMTFSSDVHCTNLLFSLIDAPLEEERNRLPLILFLAHWLQSIVNLHPLCHRQQRGAHSYALQYHHGSYNHLPWTAMEDAQLRQEPQDRLFPVHPGRSTSSVRRRVAHLQQHPPAN
jgi:hypothetical protein